MFKFLKKLLWPTPEPTDEEHERNWQAVIMEAFRTGKPVFGSYDENGKFAMHVMDDKKDAE